MTAALANTYSDLFADHSARVYKGFGGKTITPFTAEEIAALIDPANYAEQRLNPRQREFRNCAAVLNNIMTHSMAQGAAEAIAAYNNLWDIQTTEVCPYCKKKHTHSLMFFKQHCDKQKCIFAHGLAHA